MNQLNSKKVRTIFTKLGNLHTLKSLFVMSECRCAKHRCAKRTVRYLLVFQLKNSEKPVWLYHINGLSY